MCNIYLLKFHLYIRIKLTFAMENKRFAALKSAQHSRHCIWLTVITNRFLLSITPGIKHKRCFLLPWFIYLYICIKYNIWIKRPWGIAAIILLYILYHIVDVLCKVPKLLLLRYGILQLNHPTQCVYWTISIYTLYSLLL